MRSIMFVPYDELTNNERDRYWGWVLFWFLTTVVVAGCVAITW